MTHVFLAADVFVAPVHLSKLPPLGRLNLAFTQELKKKGSFAWLPAHAAGLPDALATRCGGVLVNGAVRAVLGRGAGYLPVTLHDADGAVISTDHWLALAADDANSISVTETDGVYDFKQQPDWLKAQSVRRVVLIEANLKGQRISTATFMPRWIVLARKDVAAALQAFSGVRMVPPLDYGWTREPIEGPALTKKKRAATSTG